MKPTEEQSCCCSETVEPCCCEAPSPEPAAEACCCADSGKTAQAAPSDEPCCCSAESASSNCCCGDETGSDCCSDAAYSCEDDPYAGRKKNVIVDFLFLDLSCCDRCQGADERVARAVERCRDVLSACGFNLVLNQLYVDTPELAERYRFESSPTIRVNGVDICPSVEENDCACCSDLSGTEVTCRVFPFNGTYYEVPPTDMLVRGIMEVALQGQTPEKNPAPYVMPDNLKAFYEGKAAKDACCSCC